ncbi:MAG: stage III sporulation protein AD [Lachnospiraceae bacterium]|nr:stage III sporulation protein AD [Lachnospiraceae bacterium]MBQ9934997.1 stage III sporulation protein AD [Lachnospiraceae bacterium]
MSIGLVMAFIIIAVILAISLKSKSPEFSSLISVALGITVISLCVSKLRVIVDNLREITNYIDIDKTYIAILIKLIGIAYICEFAAGISKDAGYGAVASQIELIGKLTMLMVSLPILMQLVESIAGLM